MTIGMDLGDKTSRYCQLDGSGEMVQEGSVATTKKGMTQVFGAMGRCRIAIEVGTHSPWVSRLLKSLGHEVIVANARQVKLISASSRKDDRLDAQTLARLARIDPQLLRPIRHRSEKAQQHLMKIRVRATLVDTRTSLVNAARGMTKAVGERLPACAYLRASARHCFADGRHRAWGDRPARPAAALRLGRHEGARSPRLNLRGPWFGFGAAADVPDPRVIGFYLPNFAASHFSTTTEQREVLAIL